jgi:hypothetical protein
VIALGENATLATTRKAAATPKATDEMKRDIMMRLWVVSDLLGQWVPSE